VASCVAAGCDLRDGATRVDFGTLTRADGTRSIAPSSHIGHVTSPPARCRAYSSPEANQPSKRWDCPQVSS
jgi:hypothetical protein